MLKSLNDVAAGLEASPRQAGATEDVGQIVIVLQGGGALGAYQAGVYQALHEAGVEPDWLIGTSIGAINASLIAGNPPHDRLAALEEFWDRMAHKPTMLGWPGWQQVAQSLANLQTVTHGIPAFFEPNPAAFLGSHVPLGPDDAGYYSTAPLAKTLGALVDFDLINQNRPRLTVGAAQVRTSMMRYFDSRETPIDVRHVMASGALPPAFPAVRIDGELYWDGGILSNTPTEAIFEDNPRKNSLIFAVHLWNPVGPEPGTMWEVAHRQKDIQYSSRVASHIAKLQQAHRLRHIIKELSEYLPSDARNLEVVREMTAYGCLTRMHIVRLLSPGLANEDHTKDIDFSRNGIRSRWEAGRANTLRALEWAPWRGEFDPLAGIILHELSDHARSTDIEQQSVVVEPGRAEPTTPSLPIKSLRQSVS
jgi:NTE family protein